MLKFEGLEIMPLKYFSTHLLDRALAGEGGRNERKRQEGLAAVFAALDELSHQISFEEAYVFGSLAKPYRFFEGSDVDIAFIGLRNEDFFQATAFLSREIDVEVDVLQLEGYPMGERIVREGIRWKRRG